MFTLCMSHRADGFGHYPCSKVFKRCVPTPLDLVDVVFVQEKKTDCFVSFPAQKICHTFAMTQLLPAVQLIRPDSATDIQASLPHALCVCFCNRENHTNLRTSASNTVPFCTQYSDLDESFSRNAGKVTLLLASKRYLT